MHLVSPLAPSELSILERMFMNLFNSPVLKKHLPGHWSDRFINMETSADSVNRTSRIPGRNLAQPAGMGAFR